jgi:predicted AlkP superfamily pyrophosphatase or phosphodiesterase
VSDVSPRLPDYAGACISNVVPTLLDAPTECPAWLPQTALAEQVVLLVIDGLGWEQLQDRRGLAPTLMSMAGGPITAVAPSTTATALTSITTGLPPGEHGVVGYRMNVDGDILNVLRWQANGRDARASIPPEKVQSHEAFGGQRPPVVTRAEFRQTGFTTAHLDRTRIVGWRMPSTLVTEVGRLARSGEPFVYAYYEGVDKVAHEYGLADHYDAELAEVDHLVGAILEVLPPEVALVVTADHGQVDVGDNLVTPAPEVMSHVHAQSGEGRFRWLHARPGHHRPLLDAAIEHHGDVAWVVGVDEVIEDGWFGPVVTDVARRRLGDVALVARDDVSFVDPADSGPFELVARHGSLTSAEMLVPLLVATA